MFGSEAYLTGLLAGANPDRASASHKRKRIVPDQFSWPFKRERNWIVRVGPHCSKFIGYAQHNASAIRTIGLQLEIVWQQQEFRIDAPSRQRLRNHLLAANEAIDAQITPAGMKFLEIELGQFENKWRVLQVLELSTIGSEF